MDEPKKRKHPKKETGPRQFDLDQKSNEQEEEGGGYARTRKPAEHPLVPLLDLPNRGG